MAETSVILIGFNCVFREVRAYTATVSYRRRSTWITYQKRYILVSDV